MGAVPSPFAALRHSLREAFGDDSSLDPRAKRVLLALMSLFSVVFYALCWQRYDTFHSRNFDLAFYARLSWGEAHHDAWEPILGASVYGLHFVWLFEATTWLGELIGHVRCLILMQSVAIGLTALPLARMASRVFAPLHCGTLAAVTVALAFFLHPNVGHVATNDVHPGTLALLPLGWMVDALHRKNLHGLVWSSLGVLLCREDLALTTALFGMVFALTSRDRAQTWGGLVVTLASLAYFIVFLGLLHPRFAPPAGSLQLHFGHWHVGEGTGGGVADVLHAVVTRPLDVLAWVTSHERLPYLVVITASLALLPLLAPEWLFLALPLLATNLLSQFPTTLFLDSHYLTPALPMLLGAALVGASRLGRWAQQGKPVLITLLLASLGAHLAVGASPLSLRYDAEAFTDSARTMAIRRAVSVIPEGASVQAPERMLAHFAERRVLRRPPPPETNTDYVVLDAWSRRVHRHHEALLRTEEEPTLRDWLARADHALVFAEEDFYVLRRGGTPEESVARARFVTGVERVDDGLALSGCLSLIDATMHANDLVLTLGARAPCETDLALRLGWGYRPGRVDLIAEGALSPALFRAGDRITSVHPMSPEELRQIRAHGLRVGAIRQSGARPAHGDPVGLDVALHGLD